MKYDNLTPLDKGTVLSEEQALAQLDKYKNSNPDPLSQIPDPNLDYILLENIICKDSEGRVREIYPKLYVATDIVRDETGEPVYKKISGWITYFEDQNNGLFLPSIALTYNILETLLKKAKTYNPAVKVLLNYKRGGRGIGGHTTYLAQNTIVDWESNEIIHYPQAAEFPELRGRKINLLNSFLPSTFDPTHIMGRCVDFNRNISLVANIPGFKNFMSDLTGLDLDTIQNITDYLERYYHISPSTGKTVALVSDNGPGLEIYFAKLNSSSMAIPVTTQEPTIGNSKLETGDSE